MILGMNIGQSYPIALAGRVPVKFSSENGLIKKGDRLTAASIPGYAMKATVSGRVIGAALENFDPDKAADCPEPFRAQKPQLVCGGVMVFVNLSDYSGQSLGSIASSISTPLPSGMELGDGTPIGSSTAPNDIPGMEFQSSSQTNQTKAEYDAQMAKSQEILEYLKLQSHSNSGFNSEIFTGQL